MSNEQAAPEPTPETWKAAGKIASISGLGLCEEKTLLTRAIAHALATRVSALSGSDELVKAAERLHSMVTELNIENENLRLQLTVIPSGSDVADDNECYSAACAYRLEHVCGRENVATGSDVEVARALLDQWELDMELAGAPAHLKESLANRIASAIHLARESEREAVWDAAIAAAKAQSNTSLIVRTLESKAQAGKEGK